MCLSDWKKLAHFLRNLPGRRTRRPAGEWWLEQPDPRIVPAAPVVTAFTRSSPAAATTGAATVVPR
jgi:hypothetical protein